MQIRHLDSCFLCVLRTQPSTLKILSFRASVCHRMTKSYISSQNSAACVLTGGQSIFLTFAVFTSSLCYVARIDSWTLFSWFLKGSWHCSHSFGLADFAPTISLSIITVICLESRGFGTLKMMTCTWWSHSVSFVYNFVSVDLRVCWPFLSLSCSFYSPWELCCLFEKRKLHVTQNVLDWCKHNSSYCIVEICLLILEYILKCFVIHHCNAYSSVCFFVMILLAVNFIFIVHYGNDVRQKIQVIWSSSASSKWVIKQQRQLATSTTHLAQELLMNVQ